MGLTGRELNKLFKVGAVHALYRAEGDWYHALVRFPGALFDRGGYIRFETADEYLNSPYIKHGPSENTIHVPTGLKRVPGYTPLDFDSKVSVTPRT